MFTRRRLLATSLAAPAILKFGGTSHVAHAVENGVPSVTFTVDDVERGTDILSGLPTRQAIEQLLSAPDGSLESWTQDTPAIVLSNPYIHPFLAAVTTAYDRHYPIILSPDMIWLQILQGVASHVTANAEALRHHFVSHEGKKLIEIRRDSFTKGNPNNNWEGAFAEFSDKIGAHIGADTRKLLVEGYSTTGAVEQAAMNVALMDAMQSFFVYGATTMCGFPSVTLEGTQDDWTALRARAEKLGTYDLQWWVQHLLPILDQFIAASAGRPDKDFWCNFYKLQRAGSGTDHIHGHILNFFPYFGRNTPTKERLVSDFENFIRNTRMSGPRSEVEILAEIAEFESGLKEGEGRLGAGLTRNPYIGRTNLKHNEGMTTDSVTTLMNSAPMIWNYHGTMYQMELLAGFIGSTQDPTTLAIRPKIGWAVRERAS